MTAEPPATGNFVALGAFDPFTCRLHGTLDGVPACFHAPGGDRIYFTVGPLAHTRDKWWDGTTVVLRIVRAPWETAGEYHRRALDLCLRRVASLAAIAVPS
jgi:hypothetical protein